MVGLSLLSSPIPGELASQLFMRASYQTSLCPAAPDKCGKTPDQAKAQRTVQPENSSKHSGFIKSCFAT